MNVALRILFCLAGIDLLMVFYCRVPLRKAKTDSMLFTADPSRWTKSSESRGLFLSHPSIPSYPARTRLFRDTDRKTPTQFVEFILKNTSYCLCFSAPNPSDRASLWVFAVKKVRRRGGKKKCRSRNGFANVMSCARFERNC